MPDLLIVERAAEIVLNEARAMGASYADLRSVRISTETVRLANGQPDQIDRGRSAGFAVRVLADGAWGFASAPDLNEKTASALLKEAVAIAKASARLNAVPVSLAAMKSVQGQYTTPFQVNPFEVPLQDKIDFLRELDSALRANTAINETETFMEFRREEKWFYSTEGAAIIQTILHSGAGMVAAARRSRREAGERSFPTSGGQHVAGGYEVIANFGMREAAPRISEEAVLLLDAPVLPAQETTLILSGDLVSLQIHESIGHPLELDRVFGSERNFSGTSFATPEQRGALQYAAPIVTVYSDPSAPGGLGSYGYDDEGIPARRAALIEKGVLVDYLSSRETASRIGRDSTGAMRAESWGDLPLVRMTNINLEPGSGTLEELIAETDQGVIIETPAAWSIDDRRENFQLGGEVAWEIRGGKRGQIYKGAVYSGNTVTFWNNCDRIGGPAEYRIWGTPNCGKGQPGQNMRTGQGASPARFRNVRVGENA